MICFKTAPAFHAVSIWGITLVSLLCIIQITNVNTTKLQIRPTSPIVRQAAALELNSGYKALLNRSTGYQYRTLYFDQQVDHFGFANGQTFKNRYLLADQYWSRNGGPIFLYTGNEGDIELFCNNTGFMWDIAPEFSAMLVFIEHRYYGNSMPFGKDSFQDKTKTNFLTSEQALADFAVIIRFLKSTIPGASNSPVVAFGGSYGGMLSAWFRIKYPDVAVGAIAASAPVWQFTGITPCRAFDDVVSSTWAKPGNSCADNLHNGYKTLDSIGATDAGHQFITKTFGLCRPIKSQSDIEEFKQFLAGTYVDYAMVDYPYPASFLADLPGWPVKAACAPLLKPLSGKPLLQALAHVTNVYYNYSGQARCLNFTQDGGTAALGYQGWNYQSCTEMVMPMCSDGSGVMPKQAWDFDAVSDACFKQFGVRPRRNWVELQYWGKNLTAASNIIFSNGDLDPWSSGGVTQSISDTVVAIRIKDGAHHLDLRSSNPKDTQYVRDARAREINTIKQWLKITPGL